MTKYIDVMLLNNVNFASKNHKTVVATLYVPWNFLTYSSPVPYVLVPLPCRQIVAKRAWIWQLQYLQNTWFSQALHLLNHLENSGINSRLESFMSLKRKYLAGVHKRHWTTIYVEYMLNICWIILFEQSNYVELYCSWNSGITIHVYIFGCMFCRGFSLPSSANLHSQFLHWSLSFHTKIRPCCSYY